MVTNEWTEKIEELKKQVEDLENEVERLEEERRIANQESFYLEKQILQLKAMGYEIYKYQ